MEPSESAEREGRSRFVAAFVAGAVVVLLLFGGFLVVLRVTHSGGTTQAQKLPFGAAEQSYASHIHFSGLRMAQATNFLKQEFTYVNGIVSNDGAKRIRALEVTLEFHDPFSQVVLRESRVLIRPQTRPLEGGQQRAFEITLEHIPAEWNQQYPSVRVTGLVLE